MNAVKEFLYKIADDELIFGHRNSEWTGFGPILEEDISFSSMAQDKVGHANAIYTILHEHFGEDDPDTIGFLRDTKDYKCCHLVQMPNGQYDFSLVRHFLFDHAEYLRYEMLSESSLEPLANLAKKVKGELKYHILHADTWITQLANGTEESKARLQTSLKEAYPLAFGVFEPGDHEEKLKKEGVFAGEAALEKKWVETVNPILEKANLKIPGVKEKQIGYGGRKGFHTEHLDILVGEMSEVLRGDEAATYW